MQEGASQGTHWPGGRHRRPGQRERLHWTLTQLQRSRLWKRVFILVVSLKAFDSVEGVTPLSMLRTVLGALGMLVTALAVLWTFSGFALHSAIVMAVTP